MNTYSLYDSDGRVFSVLSLQQVDQLERLVSMNGAAGYIEGVVDPETQYVQEGRVESRPPGTSMLTGSVLSGLPVPCVVSVNRMEYPCNQSSIELEFDQPGRYRIVVRAWPQIDKEFEIENPPL